jgi:hypothetical protein
LTLTNLCCIFDFKQFDKTNYYDARKKKKILTELKFSVLIILLLEVPVLQTYELATDKKFLWLARSHAM